MASVPSATNEDSDAVKKLQEDDALCEKFGITDLMLSACTQGVQEAKKLIQGEMVASGEAVLYQEPERTVTTRSGDQCVVALTDQWYLDYGNKSWNECVTNVLEGVTMSDDGRKRIIETLQKLQEYANSEMMGLGTLIPLDPKLVKESLSDSTIYMAYYTVAYLLQGGVVDGSTPGPLGICPEQMTVPVWDYVFYGGDLPQTDIPPEALRRLHQEFSYWYPVDVVVSGKDLLQKFLTSFLYDHQAIWPHPARREEREDKVCRWPKAIRTNGHLIPKTKAKKMSNSTGNTETLKESIETLSADGTRLALANSGDKQVKDTKMDGSYTDLLKLLAWVKKMLESRDKLRCDPLHNYTYHDRVFANKMNHLIQLTDHSYQAAMYREALKTGFYDMQAARDSYRDFTASSGGMNWNLVRRFIEVQALLLCPICPHISEHIWGLLGNADSIMSARWPELEGEISQTLLREADYLLTVSHKFRVHLTQLMSLSQKKSSGAKVLEYGVVYVALEYPPWQRQALVKLRELYNEEENCLPHNKKIVQAFKNEDILKDQKDRNKLITAFVNLVKESLPVKRLKSLDPKDTVLLFNEKDTLQRCLNYLTQMLNLKEMWIENAVEAVDLKECQPGKPIVVFSDTPHKSSVQVEVDMWIPVKVQMKVYHDDTPSKVLDRVFRDRGIPGKELRLVKEPSSIPVAGDSSGQAKIGSSSQFSVEDGKLYLTDEENGVTHVAVGGHLQCLAYDQ